MLKIRPGMRRPLSDTRKSFSMVAGTRGVPEFFPKRICIEFFALQAPFSVEEAYT